MGHWLLYAGMFLFAVFVVFMTLMVVVASFVRIYQVINSATCSHREVEVRDSCQHGLNVSPIPCHSSMTEDGEKTYDDMARARVADGAVCTPPA